MGASAFLRGGRAGLLVAAGALAVGVTAVTAADGTIATGLDDPRGIALGPGNRVLVVETVEGAVTELKIGKKDVQQSTVATLPGAVDVALRGLGQTYVVIGTPPPDVPAPETAGKLLRVNPGGQTDVVADIAAYQQTDPDPDDGADPPPATSSNPNGLALLGGNRVLVVDAENNDLLMIDAQGAITTVARLKPENIPWPTGLPFGPPAGTLVPAESVPTAVAVGPDGAWYVSELKGFPFSPGTSRIWRIQPGADGAVCDPAHPNTGDCTSYQTGFTSVIDLAWGRDRELYVLEIVKAGLIYAELGLAPPVGALWKVQGGSRTEIAPGSLLAPGGVAVGKENALYVTTGTIFGPGAGAVVKLQG